MFRIEKANQAIALVAPITKDIIAKMAETQRLHAEVKHEKGKPEASEVEMLEKLRHAEKLLNEVEHHMKELSDVGVLFKDFQLGVVDFPCRYENRTVYLCWMYGEKEIRAWHEIHEGFTERKDITPAFFEMARV